MVINIIKKILNITCILILVFLFLGIKAILVEEQHNKDEFVRHVQNNFKDLKVKKC